MHDPRPILLKRPFAHEKSEMIAWRDLVTEMLRRRSDQPRHGQQLFGSHHVISARGQQDRSEAAGRGNSIWRPSATKLPAANSLCLYSFSMTSR